MEKPSRNIFKIITSKYFISIIRILLGLFFIYAAQNKIANLVEFAQAISAYDIIPNSFIPFLAIVLPWLEVYCGLFLLTGFLIQSSSFLGFTLLFIFTVNIVIALIRGLNIDCGCGASITGVTQISLLKVFENILLMILIMIINASKSFYFSLDSLLSKRLK